MKQIHSKVNWRAKHWCARDDELLINLYNRRLPIEVLVNNLEVCSQFIRDRVKHLGLKKKNSTRVYKSFLTLKWKWKLDPIKAREIRRLYDKGIDVRILAHKYKINRKTVYLVTSGKIWREKVDG